MSHLTSRIFVALKPASHPPCVTSPTSSPGISLPPFTDAREHPALGTLIAHSFLLRSSEPLLLFGHFLYEQKAYRSSSPSQRSLYGSLQPALTPLSLNIYCVPLILKPPFLTQHHSLCFFVSLMILQMLLDLKNPFINFSSSPPSL